MRDKEGMEHTCGQCYDRLPYNPTVFIPATVFDAVCHFEKRHREEIYRNGNISSHVHLLLMLNEVRNYIAFLAIFLLF